MSGPANDPVLPHSRAYLVGEVEVRPHNNIVIVNGEERYLRQQTMQVLTYFLERPGELVSKDALLKSIWNDTAVTDDALVQCVVEIRKALGDDPRRPKFVRTVPKGGYCFIGPVSPGGRPTAAPPTAEVADPVTVAAPVHARPVRRLPRWAKVAMLVAGVGAVLLIAGWPRLVSSAPITWPSKPGHTRVIVAPFTNQTDDADLNWLRRGLPEMLVTDLSRATGLNVLAPSELARLREVALAPGDVSAAVALAKLAGADAIITGAFAAVGDALRVDVRVHAADGSSLGAESLTAARREVVLAEIDHLAERLSRALGRPLTPQQSASRLSDVMTSSLSAFREYSLGVEKATALQWDAALTHFEAAAKADPSFAMAQARIGYVYAVTMGWPDRGEPYLSKAFQQVGRLREKDRLSILAWYSLAKLDFEGAIVPMRELIERFPDDLEFYRLLSRTLRGEERWAEAQSVIESGLKVSPANKDLHNELWGLYSATWRLDDAIAAARKYVELSPAEPNAHDSLGLAFHQAGRYDDALASYNRAIALDPQFDIAVIHVANTYAEQGRYRDALAMYQRHIDMMRFPEMRRRGLGSQAFVHHYRGDTARAWQLLTIDPPGDTISLGVAAMALIRGDRARFEAELKKPERASNRGLRSNAMNATYVAGLRARAANRREEAIAAFRESTTHAPTPWNFPSWDDGLAETLFLYQRWGEAEAEYKRLLARNPSKALYEYQLGQIAERTARPADALRAYERMIAAWPKADSDIKELQHARAFVARGKTHD